MVLIPVSFLLSLCDCDGRVAGGFFCEISTGWSDYGTDNKIVWKGWVRMEFSVICGIGIDSMLVNSIFQ